MSHPTAAGSSHVHCAWVIALVTVVVMLTTAGWIATVPPTVKLTTEAFGRENTGMVYGWIGASHQLGALMAAFGAGPIRTGLGDYRLAFLTAGLLCLIAGASFLIVGRALRPDAHETQPVGVAV